MLESMFEQAVRRFIKARGGRCFKWVCPGETGVPDRICIMPGGHVVFIELKRPGRKDGMSPRQKKMLRVLQGLGCDAWRIDSMEELEKRFEERGWFR